MKFVMTQAVCPEGMELLKDQASVYVADNADPNNYLDEMHDADALIVRIAKCDGKAIAGSPNLKVIGRTGVGYDSVDVAEATKRGIPVVITPGANNRSVAEHAVAMMFALGSFIEVSSMTGIRGYFSLKILGIETPVVMLVLMALSIVIGLFLGAPLPGFLAAYAVFPIGWLANTVIVTGVASSLGIAYLLAMRGGLVGDTVNALELTDVSWKGTVKHLLLPAALLLAMGVVMVVFGDSMTALIL